MNEEKADQLLAAVTTLRHLMEDPEVRRALPNLPFDVQEILTPTLCQEDELDEQAAVAGKPAPSKPKVVATPAKPTPKTEATPKEPETMPVSPEPAMDLVNSSTHRKEHARLTRRMQSIDPDKYPEMLKMWNGNRQDRMKYTVCRCNSFPFVSHECSHGFQFYFVMFVTHFVVINESLGLLGKERSDLLRQFITTGESLDATESSLVISKEQEGEMEKGKELLTIKEMVDRGFSEIL